MIQKTDLLGAWHLQSWTISYSDRDEVTLPFGDDPTGMIVYTDDGWMTAAINRCERALLPTGVAFRKVDRSLLAEAYLSYFQYSARYHIDEGVVTHSVTQSLNPNFVGTEQRRTATLDAGRLTLAGEEQAGAVVRTHRLLWQRYAREGRSK